jgi:hypothetical protein
MPDQDDRLVGCACLSCGLKAVAEAHWKPSFDCRFPWLVRCCSCGITWRARSRASDHSTGNKVGYLWPALDGERGPLLDEHHAFLAKIDRDKKAAAETYAKALAAAVRGLRKGATQHAWSPASAFTQHCTWCGVLRRLGVRPSADQEPTLRWSYALDNWPYHAENWTVPGAPEPPGKLECIARIAARAAEGGEDEPNK